MKKRLFLTGPDREANAALIRSVLGGRLACAGGFLSVSENRSGLSLLPAAGAVLDVGQAPLPYLFCSDNCWRTDNEVFRDQGSRYLREALWYPYAVLDPLGGFELLIPQYREALTELLNADLPLLAVLLSPSQAEQQRGALGLGEKMTLYVQQLHRVLKADPESEIAVNAGLTAVRARHSLDAWVREFAE